MARFTNMLSFLELCKSGTAEHEISLNQRVSVLCMKERRRYRKPITFRDPLVGEQPTTVRGFYSL